MLLSRGSGRLSPFGSNVYLHLCTLKPRWCNGRFKHSPNSSRLRAHPVLLLPHSCLLFYGSCSRQKYESPLTSHFRNVCGGGGSRSISAPPQRPDTRLLEKCQLPRCRLSESASCTPSPLLKDSYRYLKLVGMLISFCCVSIVGYDL